MGFGINEERKPVGIENFKEGDLVRIVANNLGEKIGKFAGLRDDCIHFSAILDKIPCETGSKVDWITYEEPKAYVVRSIVVSAEPVTQDQIDCYLAKGLGYSNYVGKWVSLFLNDGRVSVGKVYKTYSEETILSPFVTETVMMDGLPISYLFDGKCSVDNSIVLRVIETTFENLTSELKKRNEYKAKQDIVNHFEIEQKIKQIIQYEKENQQELEQKTNDTKNIQEEI